MSEAGAQRYQISGQQANGRFRREQPFTSRSQRSLNWSKAADRTVPATNLLSEDNRADRGDHAYRFSLSHKLFMNAFARNYPSRRNHNATVAASSGRRAVIEIGVVGGRATPMHETVDPCRRTHNAFRRILRRFAFDVNQLARRQAVMPAQLWTR